MGWQETLAAGLKGGALALMRSKWAEIENPNTLRYAIRGDIRGLSEDDIRTLVRDLDQEIHLHSLDRDERNLRDQKTMVKELLIEEANRLFRN
jgi:hypothetical protein